MTCQAHRYTYHKERGFTLLEVLVAVLVLSFGLLGLAGLQAASIRANHSAYLRSQATQLAYDMADRMRANISAVDAGNYNNPSATISPSCYAAGGCAASVLAADDAYRWNQAIAAALPPGSAGVVCIDSTPNSGVPGAVDCDGLGRQYVVKVWWRDDPTNPTSFQRFVVSFRP